MTVIDQTDGMTLEIADPCWLYAWRTSDSHLAVYRSVLIRDTDELFDQARALIGDAELVQSEIIEDESMMFGRAELLVYELPELVAA